VNQQTGFTAFRSGNDTAPIAVLIAMPLIVALFGRNWLYTPIGYLDPWYNIGFFLFYHDSSFLADHYKVQRLPWILPGWILYHSLGAVVANFVLHIGALLVSTVFVYLTLARLVTRQSAFVVAAFLTIYIPFHGAGGWDYQAAGAAAYQALTFYMVTRAAQARDPRNELIGAGVAFAAATFATIHLVNFLPVFAAFYFVIGRHHRTRIGVRTAIVYGLIGFSGLTLALCVLNLAIGRGFFFFWPLLKIVLERVADPTDQKPWLLPWPAFFAPPGAFLYLVFPMVIFLGSFLRLIASVAGIGRLGTVRTLLLVQLVFLVLLWAVWQELGHVALHPDYFAHILIVPTFLALGGLLGAERTEVGRCSAVMLIAGLLLAFVPALQVGMGEVLEPLIRNLSQSVTVAGLAALSVAVFLVSLFARRVASTVVALFLMAFFSFSYLQVEMALARSHLPPSLYVERYAAKDTCLTHEQSFREIVRLLKILRTENPVLWQTWIWRGPKGERTFGSACIVDLANLRSSTHSTGISSLGLPTDTHPSEITDEYLNYVVDGGLVVAMVQNERDADGLIERFAAYGKKLTLIRREEINLGKVPVIVLIYRSLKMT